MPLTRLSWKPGAARWRTTFRPPSFPEILFAVMLLAAFGRLEWRLSLLSDGDPGWHIRTGELILQTGSVPFEDPFSYSRPGQPWFAWEWLSDVMLAKLHAWGGLEAVAAFAAAVISCSAALLLCWLLQRGAGLWIGLAVTLAVVSASSLHHLARPHILSLLLFTIALRLVDEDRRRPRRQVWILVPLAALWANLHGGFVAWLGTLALLVAATAWEGNWTGVRRYGWLAALSAAATLVNPYGWRLHEHIFRYLRSSWILENVQEFQSPRIRSENMLVFAILLLAGVALASQALARRKWFEGGLVLLWALASLRSARHIPLFSIAAAPVIAAECARGWATVAARASACSAARMFWDSGQEMGRFRRWGLWAPVLGALAVMVIWQQGRIADFPDKQFPVTAVTRNLSVLTPPSGMPRVLTSDQWADYLIYRFYPRLRVFFDGRSDFYGPAVGADYKSLLQGERRWPELFAHYRFDIALLPVDWPLASILDGAPDWERVYQDSAALLFVRRHSGLKTPARDAESIGAGG